MVMARIAVDFNTMMTDQSERVLINPIAQDRNLLPVLEAGKHVVLYDEEMEVEAMVEFDAEHHRWLGQPDWTTRRDIIA